MSAPQAAPPPKPLDPLVAEFLTTPHWGSNPHTRIYIGCEMGTRLEDRTRVDVVPGLRAYCQTYKGFVSPDVLEIDDSPSCKPSDELLEQVLAAMFGDAAIAASLMEMMREIGIRTFQVDPERWFAESGPSDSLDSYFNEGPPPMELVEQQLSLWMTYFRERRDYVTRVNSDPCIQAERLAWIDRCEAAMKIRLEQQDA